MATCGQVEFATEADADKAMAFDRKTLGSRCHMLACVAVRCPLLAIPLKLAWCLCERPWSQIRGADEMEQLQCKALREQRCWSHGVRQHPQSRDERSGPGALGRGAHASDFRDGCWLSSAPSRHGCAVSVAALFLPASSAASCAGGRRGAGGAGGGGGGGGGKVLHLSHQ